MTNERPTDLDNALATCLEKLETGAWTVEDCLAHYPAYQGELEPLLHLAVRLRQTQALHPAPAFQQQAAMRMQARLEASSRPPIARSPLGRPAFPKAWQLATAATGVAAAAIVALAAIVGLLFAANRAAPGDRLYALDHLVEQFRQGLAGAPEAAIQLHLSLAEERLAEAEQLAGTGDTEHSGEALDDYSANALTLVETITEAAGISPDTLEQVREVFTDHLDRLGALPDTAPEENVERATEAAEAVLISAGGAPPTTTPDSVETPTSTPDQDVPEITPTPDEGGEPEAPPTSPTDSGVPENVPTPIVEEAPTTCYTDPEPHPQAVNLSEVYGVPYEDIMKWFCKDHGFGEIEEALQLSQESGVYWETIMEMRESGMSWGAIKKELGQDDDDKEKEDKDK